MFLKGKDALTISIEKGDYESFSLLLSAGAETDYRCTDDVPPLVAALSQDNVEVCIHYNYHYIETKSVNC